MYKASFVNIVPTKATVDYDRIYWYTEDPGCFNRFEGDRCLNKKHVKEIQNTIENGKYGAKYIAPIRIDINTLNSADGKHRYEAFRQAWANGCKEAMRVQFEDLPEDPQEAMNVVVDINNTDKGWGIADYENKLRVSGNNTMIAVEKFAKEHSLTRKLNKKGEVTGYYARYAYAIIFGRNITKDVKEGKVPYVTPEQLMFANRLHYELERLVEALDYGKGNWFETFAQAWHDIRLNDKMYNKAITNIGIDIITKNILEQLGGLHPKQKKEVWLTRFRTAIGNIQDGLESKKITA